MGQLLLLHITPKNRNSCAPGQRKRRARASGPGSNPSRLGSEFRSYGRRASRHRGFLRRRSVCHRHRPGSSPRRLRRRGLARSRSGTARTEPNNCVVQDPNSCGAASSRAVRNRTGPNRNAGARCRIAAGKSRDSSRSVRTGAQRHSRPSCAVAESRNGCRRSSGWHRPGDSPHSRPPSRAAGDSRTGCRRSPDSNRSDGRRRSYG